MTWVVKAWRTDALERLLTEEALASTRAARETAERDARRARRAADRTAADAAAELEALERFGAELQASVRRMRRPAGGTDAVSPSSASAPGSAAPAGPEPAAAPPAPLALGARRRRERASMLSPALAELFRATASG